MISFARHSSLSGQTLDFWQLHFLSESCLLCFSACIFLLLSLSMMTSRFGMQLYDNLMVFLLNILWRLFDVGKHCPMIFRNSLPTLVFTFLLYGGLYQMILCFLVLLWLPVVLGFL